MAGWSGEEYHFRKATEQQPERAVGNEAGKEAKEKSWPDLEVGDPWIELMEGIIRILEPWVGVSAGDHGCRSDDWKKSMLETSKKQVYDSQCDKFYSKEAIMETERMWINRRQAMERRGKL